MNLFLGIISLAAKWLKQENTEKGDDKKDSQDGIYDVEYEDGTDKIEIGTEPSKTPEEITSETPEVEDSTQDTTGELEGSDENFEQPKDPIQNLPSVPAEQLTPATPNMGNIIENAAEKIGMPEQDAQQLGELADNIFDMLIGGSIGKQEQDTPKPETSQPEEPIAPQPETTMVPQPEVTIAPTPDTTVEPEVTITPAPDATVEPEVTIAPAPDATVEPAPQETTTPPIESPEDIKPDTTTIPDTETKYDAEGYDKNGFDKDGFDKEGFDKDGYNKDGFNRKGFDKEGFDKDGYNENGYNREGFDREGFDQQGFDMFGYDRNGFDIEGYDVKGFDKEGFNKEGFDKEGFDKEGFDKDGYNRSGYDKEGYDVNGFNKEGFNKAGFDRDGFNKDGYDKDGFNKDGFDKEGYDRNGFNKDGIDKDGFDKEGFDKNGFNREGLDKNGFNKEGWKIETESTTNPSTGQITSKRITKTNKNGEKVIEVYTYANNKVATCETTKYDKNGKPTVKHTYNANTGAIVTRYFDSNGKIINKKAIDSVSGSITKRVGKIDITMSKDEIYKAITNLDAVSLKRKKWFITLSLTGKDIIQTLGGNRTLECLRIADKDTTATNNGKNLVLKWGNNSQTLNDVNKYKTNSEELSEYSDYLNNNINKSLGWMGYTPENTDVYKFGANSNLSKDIASNKAFLEFVNKNRDKLNAGISSENTGFDQGTMSFAFNEGDLYYSLHNVAIVKSWQDSNGKTHLILADAYDFSKNSKGNSAGAVLNRVGAAAQEDGELKSYVMLMEVVV